MEVFRSRAFVPGTCSRDRREGRKGPRPDGKIGLVLAVVATAAGAFGIQNEADDLNRQVDFLLKVATSPYRSWVARELVFKGGTHPFSSDAVPTGKFLCGRAGEVPKECTPSRSEARTTELCVFPHPADAVGVAPGKFGTPRLCPESILHPNQ